MNFVGISSTGTEAPRILISQSLVSSVNMAAPDLLKKMLIQCDVIKTRIS